MIRPIRDTGLTSQLVGESPQISTLRDHMSRLASCDVNLLLQGESGVGKELVARTVHHISNRSASPFIGVNCAAIHATLLESELFGHEAGAYTGADKASLGFLRAADGGTILLDEVGDMSSPLQSKLLRVLEERSVVPVGATQAVPIDVRVIAATNRNLAKEVDAGTFRQDLYYRLNVVCLDIPPLRQRRQDIPLLVDCLVTETAEILSVPVKSVSPAALEIMINYDWPGNVRQLGNVIQRAYVLGHGPAIQPSDLPESLLLKQIRPKRSGGFMSLHEATRCHVQQALELSGGVRSRAAKILEIDRKSLWRMMQRYDIV